MTHADSGGSAFPSRYEVGMAHDQGMTLRDYFAAAAIQGLLKATDHPLPPEWFAANAYAVADVMLKERAK